MNVCVGNASYSRSVWPHTAGLFGLEVQLMTACVGNASYNRSVWPHTIGLSGLIQ